MRGTVRNVGGPFSLKDAASNMSLVTQHPTAAAAAGGAGGAGAGAGSDGSSIGKVPPTQLVVTQHKQHGNVVGLPSLPTGQSVTQSVCQSFILCSVLLNFIKRSVSSDSVALCKSCIMIIIIIIIF